MRLRDRAALHFGLWSCWLLVYGWTLNIWNLLKRRSLYTHIGKNVIFVGLIVGGTPFMVRMHCFAHPVLLGIVTEMSPMSHTKNIGVGELSVQNYIYLLSEKISDHFTVCSNRFAIFIEHSNIEKSTQAIYTRFSSGQSCVAYHGSSFRIGKVRIAITRRENGCHREDTINGITTFSAGLSIGAQILGSIWALSDWTTAIAW
jgi:hypothetical protein